MFLTGKTQCSCKFNFGLKRKRSTQLKQTVIRVTKKCETTKKIIYSLIFLYLYLLLNRKFFVDN